MYMRIYRYIYLYIQQDIYARRCECVYMCGVYIYMLIVYIYISLIYETDIYMHIIYIIYILYISYTSYMSTICVFVCVYTYKGMCILYTHM